MIKAVVFDYGNVISEPQDTSCYERMSALSGIDREYFTSAFWKYRPEYDRGTLGGKEMYERILRDAGFDAGRKELEAMANALLHEDLESWAHVSRAVTDWALSLQTEGMHLGILSNMPRDFLERYRDRIVLFSKADTAVFSCEITQVKPEQAIYETLIGRIGCKPDEIIFFDDMPVNVEAALVAGIHAFLWTGLERARNDFSRVSGS